MTCTLYASQYRSRSNECSTYKKGIEENRMALKLN